MTLELPNYTIFIQFLLFMGSLFVLTRFVFNPVMAVIEERRKKTTQALEQAQSLTKEATVSLDAYREKMGAHKETLKSTREGVRKELSGRETEKIAELRGAFLETMKETRKSVFEQLKKAEVQLTQDIETLSAEIYTKFSQGVSTGR